MSDNSDLKQQTLDNRLEEKNMDWTELVAYGCAISVGLAATVLLGTSIGKLLKAGIIRKGAKLLI